MENIEKIINTVNIPDYINEIVERWDVEKEDNQYAFLLPDFGLIEPCIGQPFFLVIDKEKISGNIVFRDTSEWQKLNLDEIY